MIANQSTPIYVPAKDLVDIYIADTNAKEVQIGISGSNVISAELVDGGVTEAKLFSDVKTKLNKTWEEVGVAKELVDTLAKEQVKTNTEAIDALTTRVDEVEEDYKAADATLKEEIDGKADKGNAIIDNTTALVRTNPESVLPYASINEVGGMTRKCTNLIPFSYKDYTLTQNGITFTPNSDGSIQISGTATAGVSYYLISESTRAPIKAGTYILSLKGTADNNVTFIIGVSGDKEYNSYVGDSPILTISKETTFYVRLRVATGATVNGTYYPMLNEGTEALPYKPYFEGLRSTKITRFESVGKNLFGGEVLANKLVELSNATKDETKGTVAYTASAISGDVLYTDFKPKTQYTFIFYGRNTSNGTKTCNMKIRYTDETGVNAFQFEGAEDSYIVFTSAANKTIARLYGSQQSGTTTLYYDKCGIFEGVLTVEDFKPYVKNILSIPEAVQAIDGYGDGLNDTIYNYVDLENGKFIKKVGKVDMGTLTWQRNSAETPAVFFTSIEDIVTSHSTATSVLCANYIPADVSQDTTTMPSKTFMRGYGDKKLLFVKDEDFTNDVDGFKAAVSGNMLYYELAEPVITDISDILYLDNTLEVYEGGMVEIVTDDEYTESVPTCITYYTNNNEIIGANTLVGNLIGTANKAIFDDKGNEISSTYATKEDLGNYKTKQTAVSDPSASGETTSFISSITQNENGEITVSKKNIPYGFTTIKVGSTSITPDKQNDTLEIVAGTNITITSDATNDKVTIAAADAATKAELNQLTGNSGDSFGDMRGKTVAELQTLLDTWLSNNYNKVNASTTFRANSSWVDAWNSGDPSKTISSGTIWTITIIASYTSTGYTQLRVSTYSDKSVIYISKYDNVWGPAYKIATTEDLEALEIGGRNYLKNSDVEKTQEYNLSTVIRYEYHKQPISNEQYTLSFDAKTSNGTDVMYVSIGNNDSTVKKVLTFESGEIPLEYKRFSVVVDQWPTNTNNGIIFIHYTQHGKPANENNTGTLYIKNIKLEKGNKATDWTPAPEDIDSKIDSKLSTDTKYAASSSVGGAATSAKKVENSDIVYVTAGSTIYMDRGSSTSLIFQKGGDEHARFDTSGNLIPKSSGTYNIGSSSAAWKNVYATKFIGALANALTFGTKKYDGSSAIELSAKDLGLEQAMKFIGTTTTAISDGSTTSTITVGGESVTVAAGNVVLYGGYEYVWTGSAWEQLGQEGSFSLKTHKHTINSYTPAGTINTPAITVTPSKTTIYSITDVGSAPNLDFTPGTASKITKWSAGSAPTLKGSVPTSGPNRTVTLSLVAGDTPSLEYSQVAVDDITSWSPGSAPTSSSKSVVTGISSAISEPLTFTGTEATLTMSTANA